MFSLQVKHYSGLVTDSTSRNACISSVYASAQCDCTSKYNILGLHNALNLQYRKNVSIKTDVILQINSNALFDTGHLNMWQNMIICCTVVCIAFDILEAIMIYEHFCLL